MTGVDTSFYPTQQAKPLNPLELMQGYASVSHTLGENKLLQQQIRGRQALGDIISKSMNANGTPNPPEVLRRASQNPDAAWMVLQLQEEAKNANPLTSYMGKNATGQPTPAQAPLYDVAGMNNPNWQPNGGEDQPQPSQDKIDSLHSHNRAMIDALEPLANDPSVDHKKVIRTVSDLVAHPDTDFNAADGATALSSIPFGANGQPPSAEELRGKIQELLQKQKQYEGILQQRYPSSQHIAAKRAGEMATSPVDLETPGTATGLPAGYTGNQASRQTHYQQVLDEANTVQQANAVLNNILNASKSGAPTGTKIGQIYEALAASGGAPQGVVDVAAQLQIIKSHMAQEALAHGMPASDARLAALESAGVDSAQLPQTIQTMIPFLKGVNNSKAARAAYYNKMDPTGSDPNRIAKAQLDWNNNVDPRVFELQELQHDPKGLKELIKRLSPTDKTALLAKYKKTRELGALGK